MKNGEIIDFSEYKKSKKIKKFDNRVSEEKRSFLDWFNTLPLEIKKRVETIGMKRLKIIKSFEKKFIFSGKDLDELSENLEKKSKKEILEFVERLSLEDLEQVDKIEAMKLFVAVKKIIYQEILNEK